MDQLSLFDNKDIFRVSDSKHSGLRDWELDCSEYLFDNPDQPKNDDTSQDSKKLFDNPRDFTEKAFSEYQPGGKAGGDNKYYRFSYKENRRSRHIHIKGGNITNPLAIKHKSLVEAWIRENVSLEKIIEWIKEW